MEANHTPGAWYAELDRADQLRNIWAHSDDEPILVAVIKGDLSDDCNHEPSANALLVAASPDLLEVAQSVLKTIDPACTVENDIYGSKETNEKFAGLYRAAWWAVQAALGGDPTGAPK